LTELSQENAKCKHEVLRSAQDHNKKNNRRSFDCGFSLARKTFAQDDICFFWARFVMVTAANAGPSTAVFRWREKPPLRMTFVFFTRVVADTALSAHVGLGKASARPPFDSFTCAHSLRAGFRHPISQDDRQKANAGAVRLADSLRPGSSTAFFRLREKSSLRMAFVFLIGFAPVPK
jgi:hypothetical protein